MSGMSSSPLRPLDHGWQDRARCRDADPMVFFPGDLDEGDEADGDADPLLGEVEDALAIEVAKTWCMGCAVRLTCVEAALDHSRDNHGVWGGLGSGHRIRLLQIRAEMVEMGEDVHRYVPGCDCQFCSTLDKFLRGELVDRNTGGARHGYVATYDRGCRCRGCRFAGYWNSRRRNLIGAP